jgi:HK97 family phage major capsid protein
MLTLAEKRALLDQSAKLAHDYQEAPQIAFREKREMTPEERTTNEKRWTDFEAIKAKLDANETEEKRAREISDFEARSFEAATARQAEEQRAAAETRNETADGRKPSFFRGLWADAIPEVRGYDFAEFRKMAEDDRKHFAKEKRAGFGTGAANVGNSMVPTTTYNQLLLALKPYGWWNDWATVIHTDAGNPITFPTANDTATKATIVADSGSISADTSTPFSSITLKSFKYTSGQLAVSYELLMDSAIDVDSIITMLIAQRHGRAFNYDFTLGGGTTLPFGIITGATQASLTTTGKVGVPQYADILKLLFSVNAAYRNSPKAAFMANDTTIGLLMGLVDSNGRPLINLQTINTALDLRLSGYPLLSNLDMASAALNAKSLVFGDMSKYYVRMVRDLMVITQREALATSGQIGFVSLWRADGNVMDAGTHPIQYLTGAAS